MEDYQSLTVILFSWYRKAKPKCNYFLYLYLMCRRSFILNYVTFGSGAYIPSPFKNLNFGRPNRSHQMIKIVDYRRRYFEIKSHQLEAKVKKYVLSSAFD